MKRKWSEKIFNYSTYPRDSNIYTNKGLANMDNEEQGGTPSTCFYVKDNKS